MNRPARRAGFDRSEAIDRIASRVEETAEYLLSHRDADRPAPMGDRTAAQAGSILHRDGADGMKIEMLLDFRDQPGPSVQLDRKCVIDCRQLSAGERHIDYRPANARDGTRRVVQLSCRIVRI